MDMKILLSKNINKHYILLLSVIDLTLGILSMCFTNIEWQISSTIASCLTVSAILLLVFRFKDERNKNLSALILGILDVVTGVLSIVLISYTAKAIVVTISSLKTFKASKIAIQSEKALQLMSAGKPILLKILLRIFPLVGAYVLNKILKKGNEGMENDNEVKVEETNQSKIKDIFSRLIAFMKRNVKTNIATVGNIVASLGTGFSVGGGIYFGGVDIPQYATIIIGVIITIIMFILVETGIVAKGLETQAEYDARKATEQAEAEAKEQLKLEQEAQAAKEAKEQEEKEKMIAILQEEENKEKALLEEEQAKQRAEQIKKEYKEAVASGSFQGTLLEYINQK